eukprot:38369-Rhodomonas_salina.1
MAGGRRCRWRMGARWTRWRRRGSWSRSAPPAMPALRRFGHLAPLRAPCASSAVLCLFGTLASLRPLAPLRACGCGSLLRRFVHAAARACAASCWRRLLPALAPPRTRVRLVFDAPLRACASSHTKTPECYALRSCAASLVTRAASLSVRHSRISWTGGRYCGVHSVN